jgi:virulence-associated protein VapD
MYAVSFDIDIEKLKTIHPDPNKLKYGSSYREINEIMNDAGFLEKQDNFYISMLHRESLVYLYEVIHNLSKIEWFRESVKDIRAFKVEDWSNFTEVVKFKG